MKNELAIKAYKNNMNLKKILKEEKHNQEQKEENIKLENKKKNFFDPDYIGNLVNLFL
jgi:hypothetical protein